MISAVMYLCSERKLAACRAANSRTCRMLPFASLILVCLECLSCGSYGTSSTPPPISVSVAPTSASVAVNQTKPFTATVSYDSQNKGVTWSLSCTGGSCGSISPSPTANPVTYTAPAAVPNPATVTLISTSVADGTKAATATITVTATPPPISVTVSPTSASVQVNQASSFTATVQNDSQNKGVTWSLSCTGSCGSLSPSPTANPVTYTAPASVPGSTVTLTSTSVADGTKTASATITVTSAPPPISVTVSPTSASVQVNQTSNFTATVQNDPLNKGVTWSLAGTGCSGTACGTLSAMSSPSGTPITYTAPAAVPSPATVMLTATSVADISKSASSVINVLSSTGTNTPTYANNGVSCSNTQGIARSSYVCPLPNVTGAGNAVVVFAQWNNTVTATVKDDKGNTYTQVACVAGNQEVCAYLALNVLAGARVITITPSGSINFISAAAYEFYNVATSSALDATCTAIGTGATVTCGTPINTTAANDLVLFWATQDAAGPANTTWTAGAAPWALRTADEWDNTAMEYQVQPAAGSITPSMTMSSTSGHFDGAGLALKSVTAGTPPPAGIRVAYLQHNALPPNANGCTASGCTGQVHLQFPSTGNLLVASWIGVAAYDITGINSAPANTWTSTGPAFGYGTSGDNQIFFLASAASSTNGTLAVTIASNDISGSTLQLMDITGAAASPWDQTAGHITRSGSQSVAGNVTACMITPSSSNELVVTSIGVDSNTIIGVSPGNFLSAVPQPISSPDPTDQNNGWAIEYASTATSRTYVWATQGGAVQQWASIAVAFKAQ